MALPDYPRTLHLGDSGGGRSRHSAPFSALAGQFVVVEEKVDGSHCGLFFDGQAELRIFSRNSVLESPPARRGFRLLHRLAHEGLDALWEVLGTRYVLYGEWALQTHTIFYDALPSFFLEDDVYDRERGRFLSTAHRRALTGGLPPALGTSAAVLFEGTLADMGSVRDLVGPSRYKSAGWRGRCPDRGRVEDSDAMEGLYIKAEDEAGVTGRYKWVRPEFLDSIAGAGGHWQERAEVRNILSSDR